MLSLFPYPSIREQQQKAIDFVDNTFQNKKKKFCIIEAGTGVGKSAIGVYTANLLEMGFSEKDLGSYFLTTQKILQDQYMSDFSKN